MGRFFVDTGDGIHFLNTEEEAKSEAEKALAFWRDKAGCDGEWDDNVDQICWGEIREQVRAVAVGDGGDYTDYQLRAV